MGEFKGDVPAADEQLARRKMFRSRIGAVGAIVCLAGDGADHGSHLSRLRWLPFIAPLTYDFSQFETSVDVGGGEGALLRDILTATPVLRGVLFDLPQVVTGAAELQFMTGR
jgi:hypothetical protein